MSLDVHKKLCIGCRICELVCNFFHEEKFGTNSSIIKIKFNKDGELEIFLEKHCNCKGINESPCIELCPVNAISLSSSNENRVIEHYYEGMKL